ncbi:group II truncated hemoglobin [Methylorubrum populi]|uniref:Group II truncated hemoglobin n=1 Tax=Methylorubrum rhodesianum TaxID=29427 RepID=A0ABU9ZHI0_9HYPH|nr:group II truncated hemoglobin [Methylorubrum rhodesianum]MBK3406115.1 group II truncated hemoglobin [Methylorubrum rhodesianum]MBY0143702.1 group II truncated hemoglobin [Methylorubrum populi]
MPTLYDQIGEEKLRLLVETFYDIVERDSAAEELHILHIRGHGVGHSRTEQFNFLSGFFGGPKLYIQKFGHANLKKIHEHVEIGPSLRKLWLDCMARAVNDVGFPPETATSIMQNLKKIAETIGHHRVES